MAYYQNLFTSASPTNLEDITQHIHPIINDEMNASLVADFEALEVQEAIKQMAPLKAPGPDGMPPIFYQNYWDLVGEEVTSSVLYFLNTASLPATLTTLLLLSFLRLKIWNLYLNFGPLAFAMYCIKFFQRF